MSKNILVIGSTSELAKRTIEELKNLDYNIYATTRSVNPIDEKVQEFHLDVSNVENFILLKEKLRNLEFDTIINFTGIAVAGAVVELEEIELRKQLDINLFALLRIIKYIAPNLSKNGKLINISSMARYGIFPFLSPYSISKVASDILLNNYALESNIKVVSIRPGAIATKFWDSSIELNKKTLNNTKNFEQEKEFLINNANKNSLHAMNPIKAAKKITQIIQLKNPKSVYNIGKDAKIAKLSRFLPLDLTNKIVKFVLKRRILKK